MLLEIFAAVHGVPYQTVWNIYELVQGEEKRRKLYMLAVQKTQSHELSGCGKDTQENG